jgi:hypothetical protein
MANSKSKQKRKRMQRNIRAKQQAARKKKTVKSRVAPR